MPESLERRVVRFGPFILDLTARQIESEGQRIWLTPKVFDALVCLVQNSDRVVSKEELLSTVWPDRHVEEANLTQTISVLRKALGENQSGAKFVATFPGRGYRFVAPIEPATAMPMPAARWRWPAFAMAGVTALAGMFAGAYALNGRFAQDTSARSIPVTRLEGMESQPAISPDKRHVAYVWTAPKLASQVVVQSLEGGGDPRPVSPLGYFAYSPAWSPDGARLAYLLDTNEGVEIRVTEWKSEKEELIASVKIPQDGLTLRNLTWDPRGKSLLVGDQPKEGGPVGIHRVSLQSGEKTPLTNPAGSYIGDFGARISPDGSRIAFLRVGSRFKSSLMVLPTFGGAAECLTEEGILIGDFDWLPNSREIVYSSNHSGAFELWRRGVRESAPRRIPGVYADDPIHLSISGDGRTLLYSVIHRQLNIWRLSLAGARTEWTKVIASTAQDTNPVYSPDGRFVCFRSNRTGEEQLWIANADGSASRQLTVGNLRPSGQSWSRDGARIAFNSNAPRLSQLYDISAAGGAVRSLLASDERGSMPKYSFDGRWIYYTTLDDEASQISRIPSSGGTPHRITRNGGFFSVPAHDSRFLYLVKDRHSSTIWRFDAATGEESPIVSDLAPGNPGYWTAGPDGIYYLGLDEKRSAKLFFHPFGERRARPLVAIPPPIAPIGAAYLSLAPDGGSLLCVRVDQADSDLMRISLR
jgi:Tol biopolymer transport system component/DNA-binding winged helix-turn-helix (wHTH) protein